MTEREALFLGYMVLWSGLFAYTIYLYLENKKLSKEVSLVRRTLSKMRRRK